MKTNNFIYNGAKFKLKKLQIFNSQTMIIKCFNSNNEIIYAYQTKNDIRSGLYISHTSNLKGRVPLLYI